MKSQKKGLEPIFDADKNNNQVNQEAMAKQTKSRIIYTGFIAQEVEQQAAKNQLCNFSGVETPKLEKITMV